MKECKYLGDGLAKIGNRNFLALCRSIKTGMTTSAEMARSGEWFEEQVRGCFILILNHYRGDHRGCFGKCSKTDLRHFFQTGQGEKAAAAISSYLLEPKFIAKLLETGESSNLEAFHSSIYSRRLYTKLTTRKLPPRSATQVWRWRHLFIT